MRADGVEQGVVGERRIAEAEIMIGRALLAQDLAHGQPCAVEQLRQQQSRRRAFEILDDVRLDARSCGSSRARCATFRMRDCDR